ncbi:MAG: nucleotide exchange factor GrpE [Nitriliruptoraceae bacterium]
MTQPRDLHTDQPDPEVGTDPTDADAAKTASQEATAPTGKGDSDEQGERDEQGDPHVDLEALADADPRTKAELLAELMTAEAKRDEYLDDLRRSHADFENYRRRVMRDGAVQRAAGKADVATALLEVLDDLDRTLDAAGGSSDADLATGVRLVATKLLDALRGKGLERIDATEVVFDPSVHEAVQQQPGEGIDGEPKVVTVLRPGYRLDDRVLRAAMVLVEG